jgi:hypothetical protein
MKLVLNSTQSNIYTLDKIQPRTFVRAIHALDCDTVKTGDILYCVDNTLGTHLVLVNMTRGIYYTKWGEHITVEDLPIGEKLTIIK